MSEPPSAFGLQALVFALVSAAFTTIYLLQPVLPILQQEFGVDEKQASLAISAVILGIALSNLPFGRLADRLPIRPIIAAGGGVVVFCGLACSMVQQLSHLVVLRFLQGLTIPALTTCLAAYLAKHLPADRLNVVMGSYVAATVAGGLGGRLLGGWIHPPLSWRYAFVTVSVLVAVATIAAVVYLPPEEPGPSEPGRDDGFIALLTRSELLRIYSVAFFSFWVFSALFNYLPFYLAGPVFNASTERITMTYMAYVLGIIVGPLSGKFSNRAGNGATMVLGALVFALALGMTHIPNLWAVVVGLCCVCIGFFFNSLGCRRMPQPEAAVQPGAGQFTVCAVLLPGRISRYYSERFRLPTVRLDWRHRHRNGTAVHYRCRWAGGDALRKIPITTLTMCWRDQYADQDQ
jgi:YNFM family putative membrane transporter